MIAVFTKIDSLPRTKVQFSARYRDGDAASEDGRFQVCRHIIRSLGIVLIIRGILRDGFIEMTFKIFSDRRVGVLVQRQRGRRVLDENVEESAADSPEFGDLGKDLRRDQMEPAASCTKGYFFLDDHRRAAQSSRMVRGEKIQRIVNEHDPLADPDCIIHVYWIPKRRALGTGSILHTLPSIGDQTSRLDDRLPGFGKRNHRI
jgi:hypothetical protein